MKNEAKNTPLLRTIHTALGGVHIRELGGESGGESSGRTIEGYAILFNQESDPLWAGDGEEGREIIAREAVTMDLLNASDIKFTMYHNRQIILARSNKGKGTLTYGIDDKGVYFSFEAPSTLYGDEALELVKRGDLNSCSFMFSTEYYNEDHVTRTRAVRENGVLVHLYTVKKISAVYDFTLAADPAYPDTSAEVREFPRDLIPQTGKDGDRGDTEPEDNTEKIQEQIREMRAAAKLDKLLLT